MESLTYCVMPIPYWLDFGQDENGKVIMTGLFSTYANAIIQKMNYNYTIIEHDELGDYGHIYGINNATGYVGYLIREGEGDLGFNTYTPGYNNLPYLEFTTTMLADNWIMMSADEPIKWKRNEISPIQIFSKELWMAYFFSLFILSITWTLIYYLIEFTTSTIRSNLVNNWSLRIYHLIIINLRQSFEEEAGLGIGARLFLLVCSLQSFWISAAFSSGILSVLTLPPEPVYLETLSDVRQYFPQSQIFVMEDSPVPEALQMSESEVRRDIYRQARDTRGLSALADFDILGAFDDLHKGSNFIIFPETFIQATLGYLMECDSRSHKIRALPERVFEVNIAFPMRKKLAHKHQKPFKRVAFSLFETGIFLRSLDFEVWVHRACFEEPKGSKENEPEALPLKAFAFAMFLWISGLVLAAIIKTIEMLSRKTSRVPRQTRH